tara:strand:+ start:299 stop:421 length:123 start_codon:yes stop_codon:yes gene_type:complete
MAPLKFNQGFPIISLQALHYLRVNSNHQIIVFFIGLLEKG